MKHLLERYTAYNVWANKKLADCCRKLTVEQWQEPLMGSFPGIRPTIAHLCLAESIWWQRLREMETVTAPHFSEQEDTEFILAFWLEQSEGLHQWVFSQTVSALSQPLSYQNLSGEPFQTPVFEVLLHVCNHSSYHRGQLINFLRLLGETDIPATDYIVYSREKN